MGSPSQEGETQNVAWGHPRHPPPIPGGDPASVAGLAKPAQHCLWDCTAGNCCSQVSPEPTQMSSTSITWRYLNLLRGDLRNAYKYLQGGCQEDGARLFPVVPSDRARGNGHKLKQRKLQLKMRKNFFTLRVTEPWPRLPREAVESPSLKIFQTCLDVVLCSLLWVTLLGQEVELGDPQRSLPTPTML